MTHKAFLVPDDLQSEEDVKIKYLCPFLDSKGYRSNCIDFDKAIEVHEGRKRKTIFADAVVYTSARKHAPLIVCETKPPTEPLSKVDTEQAISYARLLPRIAPLVLVTNGQQTRVFQSLNKNRLVELPHRKDLQNDFVRFVVSEELQESLRTQAKHELFIIDDVQSFKSILRSCHEEIRNNEGYDPATAFDEMSKVLFCKMHEERQKREESNRFRTVVFDDSLERLTVNVVKQIWDETKNDKRFQGLFDPASTINLNDRTIRKIVKLFENYDLSMTAFDVKGEAFECFLGDTFTGGLGEYFTPRNVVEFMVDAVDPKIGDRIIDPFCGTGGFLIYAFEVVSHKIRLQEFSAEEKEKWKLDLSNKSLYGTDWKERTTLACKMNMTVHGDGSAGIVMHHGLVDVPGRIEEGTFGLCITNPPFGSIENDPTILKQYELGAGRQSQDRVILAVERALRLVRPTGLVAIVVIDGILNNDSKSYVREYIQQNAWVRGVVSLPAVTFEGYNARAKTSILFLEKKQSPDDGRQEPAFMSIVSNSGYAHNGSPIPGNELPEVLIDYKAFLKQQDGEAHDGSWVAHLTDRMDAEYHQKRERPKRPTRKQLTKLIESTTKPVDRVAEQLRSVHSEVQNAFGNLKTRAVFLGDLFHQTSEMERVEGDKNYRLLGVKWWGGGTFIREEKAGKQIKGSRLNRVSAGLLVYNRLFAFRGSFAIVPAEHGGCYVSGEFPTFAVNDDVDHKELVASYVVHCLNSPQYLDEVERISTGSTKTSRNRFKENRFLTTRVDLPNSKERICKVVELLDTAAQLRQQQSESIDRIKELQNSIARMLPMPPDGVKIVSRSSRKDA